MIHYATLWQAKQYLGIKSDQTADDSRLIRFIVESVRMIDGYKQRRFDVRRETRIFDIPQKNTGWVGTYYNTGIVTLDYLRMDDDLLEVVTLTNGDDKTIAASAFWLDPANKWPKHKIQLIPSSGVGWSTDYQTGNIRQAISLDAYWGFHNRYNEAFEDSLDTVQDNPLAVDATTLKVSNADGVALDGSTQRFQAGQMLKLVNTVASATEFVFVAAVDNDKNELTVKRGFNGTTAVQHLKLEPIYIYRPQDNIVAACTRLTAWRYRQKDADVFDKTTILGTGVKIIPAAIPPDVVTLLGAPKIADTL